MLQIQENNGENGFISLEKFDCSQSYPRLSLAHQKGGLFMNKQNDEKIREVFKAVLMKIGKKILEGRIFDLMRISKPIQICYPLSFLEAIANDYVYCSKYLKLAALEKNPIKRLKYVIVANVAGYHKTGSILKNKAPLDAFLGETFQAKKSDGSEIFVEHTCSDPPKSHYLLVGPNNLYRLHGSGEMTAHLSGLNTLNGDKIGTTMVKFNDSAEIQITNPSMEVTGLLMGDRILNFVKTVFFVDKSNQLMAELTFNKNKQSRIDKIASAVTKFFRKDDSKPIITDSFQIIIYKYNKSDNKNDHKTEHMEVMKVPICEGSGSWLEYIEFDGDVFWIIDEEVEQWETDLPSVLPSNSLFREDFKNLKENNIQKGDEEKTKMENLMSADEKLRKQFNKNHK